MKRKEIETERDMYLYEIESTTIDFGIYSFIMLVITIILAISKSWLPLAVLFFSYMIGLFSGMEWHSYDMNKTKFMEKFKK